MIKPFPPHVRTIAIDFDGTIIKYLHGDEAKELAKWELIPNARQVINSLFDLGIHITIHTSRADLSQVSAFLDLKRVYFHEVCRKPVATVYIDDRALPFLGSWQSMYSRIRKFQPWWLKKEENAKA